MRVRHAVPRRALRQALRAGIGTLSPSVPPIGFVGVGAARSGSTWVARVLHEHPEVFVPARKELHLFNNRRYFRRNGRLNWRGRHRLARYFAAAGPGQVLGELTPRYMISREAISRIRANLGDVRIICVLRNPVDRAFSQFRYFRNNMAKEINSDFEVAIEGRFREDYVVKSQYTPLLRTLYEFFPPEHVYWFRYDNLCADPRSFVRDVYRAVGVDASYRPASLISYINQARPDGSGDERGPIDRERLLHEVGTTGRRPDQVLDNDVRQRVYRRFFEADVLALEKYLQADFSAWKV